jgi:hypothetical protein
MTEEELAGLTATNEQHRTVAAAAGKAVGFGWLIAGAVLVCVLYRRARR